MRDQDFEIFRRFRGDIQEYLAHNLRSAEQYMVARISERVQETEHNTIFSLASIDRRLEYERHKKELSKLCGWDAPPAKQDQDLFNRALRYLIDMLLI